MAAATEHRILAGSVMQWRCGQRCLSRASPPWEMHDKGGEIQQGSTSGRWRNLQEEGGQIRWGSGIDGEVGSMGGAAYRRRGGGRGEEVASEEAAPAAIL